MSEFAKTPHSRIRRKPDRGTYDKEAVYAILDEARICHVGFVAEGRPFVIPTIHARQGDELILHGAKESRLIKHIQQGNEICVAVTLLDGLVLARSTVHHSMNYRSVVLFGRGRVVEDEAEKLRALECVTDHIVPGRSGDARGPNAKELNAVGVAAVAIESASAKVRTGPPGDEEEDYRLPVWAGVLPVREQILPPENDPLLADGIPVPDYVLDLQTSR